MTGSQWVLARYGAVRTLTSKIIQLKNWQELWPRLRFKDVTTEFPTVRSHAASSFDIGRGRGGC